MREECWFADQPLLLAGVFTGSVDLSCDHLERAQWGPVRCAVTKVLMQERERNVTVEAANTQLTLHNDSSNLLFNQDIDSLEHPFTGELVGNIGLDLKQRHRLELQTPWNDNAILSLFRCYYKSSYCLVDDSFDSSLHICRIVHIDHPHIWLSYGLGIRVLWCHLQSEKLWFSKKWHRNPP